MMQRNSQLINTLLIVVGGAFLIFHTSTDTKNPYLMVIGLIMLMFGLYRATSHWVDTKDDHKNEEDSGEKKE